MADEIEYWVKNRGRVMTDTHRYDILYSVHCYAYEYYLVPSNTQYPRIPCERCPMEFSPTGQEKSFVLWLTFKSRRMGQDSGLGAFSNYQFHKCDHITVYIGEWVDPNNLDHSRYMTVRNGEVLDICPDEAFRQPL